jgi:hypothetical protein
LARTGRALDGCAGSRSARSWIGDALSSDRGLLSAVPDGLQCLGSKVVLCPLEFIAEDPGSLSDGRPLSELFMRRSSLQSLLSAIRFFRVFVHLGEERVIIEGLFVNARTCRVNLMSFSEVSSSSSSNGTCSSRLFWLLELGHLFFLRLGLLLEVLQVGWGLNETRRGGVENPRNGDECRLCR